MYLTYSHYIKNKEKKLTNLEIVYGAFNEEIPIKDNEKWIDLSG